MGAIPVPVLIAAVVPCYRVGHKILDVLNRIGPEIGLIYLIDDACPENSLAQVEKNCHDKRIRIIKHKENQGVGGAVCTGYREALNDGAQIVVKIDGDGQMDPALVPGLVAPIIYGKADYVKGNRFFFLNDVKAMPRIRLFGNAALSFMTKLSTGYWQIFDPTNGFTAVSSTALRLIDLSKVSRRYFFESDFLFHLALSRAVVLDFPMKAVYEDEKSSLKPGRIIGSFLRGHFLNWLRRLLYTYFIRGFSLASLELILGPMLMLMSVFFGLTQWANSIYSNVPATSGTVMLAALPAILGMQMTLSWLQYDVQSEPKIPLTSLTPPTQ